MSSTVKIPSKEENCKLERCTCKLGANAVHLVPEEGRGEKTPLVSELTMEKIADVTRQGILAHYRNDPFFPSFD